MWEVKRKTAVRGEGHGKGRREMAVAAPGKWRSKKVVEFKIQGMFWREKGQTLLAGSLVGGCGVGGM